jgi:membrane protease YdiL (CAAX protease family)
VITNEPSPQQTPLSNEPADLSEQPLNHDLQAVAGASTPPRELPWLNLLMAFGVWVMSVILLVFVPVIIALPYLVYKWKNGGVHPELLASDKTLIFLSIVGIVPTHLLTLGVVWLVVTQGRRRPFWKTLGFEWPKPLGPGLGIVLCFVAALLLWGIGLAVTTLWGGGKTDLDLLVESSTPARLATAFVAVFTAPLIEEIIYRGVLYSAIERALGVGVAIAAVSLLFAGVHVIQYKNNLGVITVITLLSATLTLARAYTGKLLPSFLIHLIFNGIQSIIIVLSPLAGSSGSS